jgi:hypothetical protein
MFLLNNKILFITTLTKSFIYVQSKKKQTKAPLVSNIVGKK